MVDVVNLRAARKRARRQQDDLRAQANRLAHGRPKNEQEFDTARQAKADRNLERHRIDRGEGQ
jgi:Domain of unknown function (DUF4169)